LAEAHPTFNRTLLAGENTGRARNLVVGRTNWVETAVALFYEGWNFNSGNYLFTTDTI